MKKMMDYMDLNRQKEFTESEWRTIKKARSVWVDYVIDLRHFTTEHPELDGIVKLVLRAEKSFKKVIKGSVVDLVNLKARLLQVQIEENRIR